MQPASAERETPPSLIFGWTRLRVALVASVMVSLLMLPTWQASCALLLLPLVGVRGDNETAPVHLKGRAEVLSVSRTYLHHFRQR